MAAGILAVPGSTYGPCEEPCQHTDCRLTRAMAAAPCGYCKKPIGYATMMYQVDADHGSLPADAKVELVELVGGRLVALAHADCHESAVRERI